MRNSFPRSTCNRPQRTFQGVIVQTIYHPVHTTFDVGIAVDGVIKTNHDISTSMRSYTFTIIPPRTLHPFYVGI